MEVKNTLKNASENTSNHTSKNTSGNYSKSAAVRLRFVDIAKGISIICIILGHLGIHNITRVVFTFHVPIFFLITGYFIRVKEGVRDFAVKKARTLLVPYFVTSLVMIAIAALNLEARWRIAVIAALFAFGYYSRNLFWFPLSIQAGACATAFMYAGHLFRVEKGILRGLSNETRVFGTLVALCTWVMFIKDFQAFWLVNCDFGRGVVDIFGCICACYVVLLGSYFLERAEQARDAGGTVAGSAAACLTDGLAYIGKYSLLVLCIHIVELNFLPWFAVFKKYGMPAALHQPARIAGKMCLDLGGAYLLSKSGAVRKLFGYKE